MLLSSSQQQLASGWAGVLTTVSPCLQGHLGFYITDLSTNGAQAC